MRVVRNKHDLQQILEALRRSDFGTNQGAKERSNGVDSNVNSKNVTDVTDLRTQPRVHNLGFVPTMGALHAGHISLVEQARRDCDLVCVSIFVNPLQFGPNEDFSKYPRTTDADLELLEKAEVDIVYLPEIADIYPELNSDSSLRGVRQHDEATHVVIASPRSGRGDPLSDSMGLLRCAQDDASPAQSTVSVANLPARNDINTETELEKIHANPELANRLCGLNRPGHFDGVCTVVKRLFDIVQPQRAYFGEKDYQQLMIIHEMVDRLKLPVKIIGCPILREADGLAMSSRNRYLSEEERKLAPMLYQELLKVKSEILHSPTTAQKRDISHVSAIQVDYLESHWNRIFIAAKLGNTRLIDNIAF